MARIDYNAEPDLSTLPRIADVDYNAEPDLSTMPKPPVVVGKEYDEQPQKPALLDVLKNAAISSIPGVGPLIGSAGFMKGAKAGSAGVVGGVADFANANLGAGGSLGDWAHKIVEKNTPDKQYTLPERIPFMSDYWTNPSGVTYDIGQAAGSSAALLPLTAAIGAALPETAVATGTASLGGVLAKAGLNKLAQKVTSEAGKNVLKWGTAGAIGKTPEAASEGGNVYRDMISDGYSPEEARAAANEVAIKNIPVLMAEGAIELTGLTGKLGKAVGIGKPGDNFAKRLGKNALLNVPLQSTVEGATELKQQIISEEATGKPHGSFFDPGSWTPEEEASLGAGLIGGAAFGGVGSVVGVGAGARALENLQNKQASYNQSQVNLANRIRHALSDQESSGNSAAYNSDGDVYGKYQFQQETWDSAARMAGREDLVGVDPREASEAAQDQVANAYIGYLLKKGDGDPRFVATAWYAGEGAADDYKETGRLSTTREGPNGEYPSVAEYVGQVTGRMGKGGESEPARFTVKDNADFEGTLPETQDRVKSIIRAYNREFPDDPITISDGARPQNADYGSPTSYHKSGEAVDFVSPGLESDPVKRARLVELARQHGFKEVLDEYSNPSEYATAGHIHMGGLGENKYISNSVTVRKSPISNYSTEEKRQAVRWLEDQADKTDDVDELNGITRILDNNDIGDALNNFTVAADGQKIPLGKLLFPEKFTRGSKTVVEEITNLPDQNIDTNQARAVIDNAQQALNATQMETPKPFMEPGKTQQTQNLANVLNNIAANKFDQAEAAKAPLPNRTEPVKSQKPYSPFDVQQRLGQVTGQQVAQTQIVMPNQTNEAGIKAVEELRQRLLPKQEKLASAEELVLKRAIMQAVSRKDYTAAANLARQLGREDKVKLYENLMPQTRNPRERLTADDIKRRAEYERLDDMEKLFVDALEHYKAPLHGIEFELENSYNKLIDDYVKILQKQVKQPGIKATKENMSGDKFTRTYSQNYKWFMDLADQHGYSANKLPKGVINQAIRDIALDHLRNGYTDPLYGPQLSEEEANKFNELEAALNGVRQVRDRVAPALSGELRPSESSIKSNAANIQQAARDTVPIAKELGAGQVREELQQYHPEYVNDKEALDLAEEAIQLTLEFDRETEIMSARAKAGMPVQLGLEFEATESGRRTGKPSTLRQPGETGVRSPGRIGKTIGLGVTPELIQEGVVSLAGEKVRSAKQLAEIAQVLRHPGYETFHIVYVKNNNVVHHEAVSCRLPNVSSILLPGENSSDFYNRLHDTIEKVGADGYYFVHNHPSGQPTPSQEDRRLTKTVANITAHGVGDDNPINRGFKGHVIINSGKFSVIDRYGEYEMHNLTMDGPDKLLSPSINHPALGAVISGPEVLATVAKSVQLSPDHSVVFYLNTKNGIRGVQVVPNEILLAGDKKVTRYLRWGTRATFSTTSAIVTDSDAVFNKTIPLVSKGYVLDTFHSSREISSRSDGKRKMIVNEDGTWMGQKIPEHGTKVLEDEGKYGPEIENARREQRQYLEKHGPTININTSERQVLRKKIADELYGAGAENKDRQVYFVLGLPASGKSSVSDPLAERTGSLIIDSDMAKERLPEFNNGKYAGVVHDESSLIADGVLEKAISNGDNIVWPQVGKSLDKIRKQQQQLRELGYDTHLLYVHLPVGKAVSRAISRFKETGRFVDPQYVSSVGYTPLENYDILKTEGGWSSYEAHSNDVQKGDTPKLLERNVAERGQNSRENHSNAGQINRETKSGSLKEKLINRSGKDQGDFILKEDEAQNIKYSADRTPLDDSFLEQAINIRFIPEGKISTEEQAVIELGKQMGVPVRFFIGKRGLRGFHTGGTTYINRNGNRGIEWAFWHETLHWLRRQDRDLYNDLTDALGENKITTEQITKYRETIGMGTEMDEDGQYLMSDEEIIEEMLGDEMADVASRRQWLQELYNTDQRLFERFVEWLKQAAAQLKAVLAGRYSHLTDRQAEEVEKSLRNVLLTLKDATGNRVVTDRTQFPYRELEPQYHNKEKSRALVPGKEATIASGSNSTHDSINNMIQQASNDVNKDDVKYSLDSESTENSVRQATDNMAKNLGLKPSENVTYIEKPTSDDPGISRRWLNSVSVIAKKHPRLKPFFNLASKAMETQEKLRQHFQHRLLKVEQTLGNTGFMARRSPQYKENKENLYRILLDGDTNEKNYTSQELRDLGYNKRVIKAYNMIRTAYQHAWKLANEVRQGVETKSENMTTAKLMKLKENKFVEILSEKQRGDDSYLVTWKQPKISEYALTVTRQELNALKDDPNVQIISEKPLSIVGHALPQTKGIIHGDEFYEVEYRAQKPPITNRAGYIPHFFHEWFVMEKDKEGNTEMLFSARTAREALKKANEFAKQNPDMEIVVKPKQFKFPGADMNAAVMGDMNYFKMLNKVSDDLEINLDDARQFLDGKVHMKNRHRFVGNFLQRKGANGWEQDLDWVNRHYFNMVSRYVAMDPFKSKSISLFERFFGQYALDYDGLGRYVKQYINDINGVPSEVERALNDALNGMPWINKFTGEYLGERPAAQLASAITDAVAVFKLGMYNISSAIIQTTQFINVASSMNSYEHAFKGLTMAIKPNGRQRLLLHRAGVDTNLSMESGAGYSKAGQMKKWFQGTTAMFRYLDVLMRRAAILGAYSKAIEEGKSQGAALEYAKEVNQKANFEYGVHDAPDIFRRSGPVGQIALQFKKYPIKQFELMADLAKHGDIRQNAKFWVPMLLLAGMWSIPAIGVLKIFANLFDWDWEKETKAALMNWAGDDKARQALVKTAMYGIMSNAGVDISRRTGMGDVIPMETRDLFGPVAGTLYQTGVELSRSNWSEAVKAVSPGIGNALVAMAGETHGYRGRLKTQYETFNERLLKGMGFMPIEESVDRDKESVTKYLERERRGEEEAAIDDYIRAYKSGDNSARQKAAERLSRLRVSTKRVRDEMARKDKTNVQRGEENISKKQRGQYKNIMSFE